MTKLIVVRHGQSEGNLAREFHGQYNSDITELGHKQAECTARFLDDYPIDVIYASDIRRAYSTALHTANRRHLEVIPDKGFREIRAGKWEKMKFDDIETQYPAMFKIWHEDIANCICPEGEAVRDVAVRIMAAFERVVKENDGKNVMIATHATPIRAMYTKWMGLPVEAMSDIRWVANASVSVIECEKDGSFRVEKYGYADHLEQEGLLSNLPKKV